MENHFYLPLDEWSLDFTPDQMETLRSMRDKQNGTIHIGNIDYKVSSFNRLTVQALHRGESIGTHGGYCERHTTLEVIGNFRRQWLARIMQNIRCMVLGFIPRYESTSSYERFRFQLSRGYVPVWIAKDYGTAEFFPNIIPIQPDTVFEYFESDEPDRQICVMEFNPDKALSFARRNDIPIYLNKFLKAKTST